jgi:CDP-diacylglycerol--glycerol-3-phosphate 3-phosphatidyltransferase
LGHQLLSVTWDPLFARRWVIVAAVVLAYELAHLWRGLRDNHRRGESALLPTLGAANVLTMLRGLALGLAAGFLLAPWPTGWLAWLPALLYTLAIVADYLDGYLARVTHHTTVLGENLDIEFDALGILVASSLAVSYHQLPWWYLVIGLSRYLFLFGIWWRKRRGRPVYDLPPSTQRRIVAGFQMGFASVMLWPIVYPPGTTLAGVAFAIPFTASFVRDWLVVSGSLDPASAIYLEASRLSTVVLTRWLPVLLRIGLVAVMIWIVLHILWNRLDPATLFAWPVLPLPSPQGWGPSLVGWAIGLVALAATLMLALGVAGRLAALGLLVAASANILTSGLYLTNGFLLVSAVALMLLGSGAFSCWCPEDALLSRRAGDKEGA